MGQPVCPAKLFEADQIHVPMPLDQEQVSWEGVGVVLEAFLAVAVGSGGFRLGTGAGRGSVDGEPWGHAGTKVWVRLRYLPRSTHRAGSGFWRIRVQRGWADAGVGAFLVGGVRLGFFRRAPDCETVVTGLAADRLFEDESVQEVPRFGGRRVDPVGFAPGADQNSPRE